MLKILGTLPEKLILGCSGGADSMAALDFLNTNHREIIVVNVNHLTPFSFQCSQFLEDYCNERSIKYIPTRISSNKPKKESLEEYWRNERYRLFSEIHDEYKIPVVTAHHLNDAVETWVFSSIHGNPNLIPYKRDYVIRPFLLNTKNQLVNWCLNKNVPYLNDPSNSDVKFARNRIRNNIIPEILKINPGIEKVIKKKLIKTNVN